jgi:polyisoprenoid-binding protein YceI
MTPPTTIWKFEAANSELRFTVSHLVIAKISGRFSRFWCTVHLDEQDVKRSSAELVIDAASIDTGNAERDEHLRSAAFLDIHHHPTIRYRSTEIVPAGRGDYLVNGELTIRGQTLPVTVFVTDRGRVRDDQGRNKAAFYAHGGFNRQEFGITWHDTMDSGAVIVGDEVEVHVEAEALQAEHGEAHTAAAGAAPASAGLRTP